MLQVTLDFADENGGTKRSHLESVWEQTGIKPADLIDPEIPQAGLDLYRCFWDVYKQDGIRWSDFYYYSLYTNVWFNGEELKIIRSMESAVRTWVSKKERARMKSSK